MEFSTDTQYLIIKVPLAEVDSLKRVLALVGVKGMPNFDATYKTISDFTWKRPDGTSVIYKNCRQINLMIEGALHICKIGMDDAGYARPKWVVIMDDYGEVSASLSNDGQHVVSIIRKAGERGYATTMDEVPPLYRGGDFDLVNYRDHVTDPNTPGGMAIMVGDPTKDEHACTLLALHAWLRRKYR